MKPLNLCILHTKVFDLIKLFFFFYGLLLLDTSRALIQIEKKYLRMACSCRHKFSDHKWVVLYKYALDMISWFIPPPPHSWITSPPLSSLWERREVVLDIYFVYNLFTPKTTTLTCVLSNVWSMESDRPSPMTRVIYAMFKLFASLEVNYLKELKSLKMLYKNLEKKYKQTNFPQFGAAGRQFGTKAIRLFANCR